MWAPQRESEDVEKVTYNKTEKKCEDPRIDRGVINIGCRDCC